VSYRAGIGQSLAARFGGGAREPGIICDGCGTTHPVYTARGDVATWFLNYRPPPKWRGVRMGDGSKSWDLCPACLTPPPEPADE